MRGWSGLLSKLPILKTLAVCPKASKKNARTELYWTVGFALLAVPIVLVIVLFTQPVETIPRHIFEVVGRGELMVYAAAVCGAALYNMRHGIDGPLPEALQSRVTPLGTLAVCTAMLLALALISYVVRRMGDINHTHLNENLLNVVSVLVLAASLVFAYVILSLKFALNSGAAIASHEQTEDFQKQWEADRDA